MSGLSAKCCGSGYGSSYPFYPTNYPCVSSQSVAPNIISNPCLYWVQTGDLVPVIIRAILRQNIKKGSSLDQIVDYIHNNLSSCSSAAAQHGGSPTPLPIPVEYINAQLQRGYRQGVFQMNWKSSATPGGRSYQVLSSMALVNPINKKYLPCLCDMYKASS